MTPTSLLDLDRDQLAAACADEPPYRVDQIWRGLYERAARPAEMTDLPLALRRHLDEHFAPAVTEITRRTSADGGTVKWLWRLHDDQAVETVLMHYDERVTVCVSTQAGCAMGCGFCATGQAGFERHLSTGEIVAQVLEARRAAAPRRVSNVVFMGMGEPLANYDRTWAAIERIHDDMGISARHITVSTVGLVPGIERLATERLPVNLAVSLHAADDELRDRLVPVNRRWPLEELARACEHHRAATGRRLSFEWALIDGVNDRPDDARRLAAYAKRLRAHVNLIPLNPTPGWPTRGTPAAGVRAFRDALARAGVNVTVRRNRGTDIEAACGQLRVERRPRSRAATGDALADSILER